MEWDVSGSRWDRWNLPLLDNMRDISGLLELDGFERAAHANMIKELIIDD
jgi:hypothetical protein